MAVNWTLKESLDFFEILTRTRYSNKLLGFEYEMSTLNEQELGAKKLRLLFATFGSVSAVATIPPPAVGGGGVDQVVRNLEMHSLVDQVVRNL